MEKETWINQGTEKLTADDPTMKVGDRDAELRTKKRKREKYVWLLVTMADKQRLNIGEKPIVFAFTSEAAAIKQMWADIHEYVLDGEFDFEDVDYYEQEGYAQTKDKRFSWEVVSTEFIR